MGRGGGEVRVWDGGGGLIEDGEGRTLSPCSTAR